MNEIDFGKFLLNSGLNKKVAGDIVSRIKRIESSIENCDIDEEYDKDKCMYLISLLSHMGKNEQLKTLLTRELPIGKYSMNTFKYAIRKYVLFRNN